MLLKFFLPNTKKIHKNYISYIKWSFISNTISSTQYVLSTHSMFTAIGKDNDQFNILYNYILKDVCGQLGSLYYINKTCNLTDKNPRKHIKNTLYLQQLSVYTECVTPYVPISMFLPLAGTANITKNITGIGIGAVNAKIIQKLSIDNNVGEVYSRISILNTISASIGMSFGLFLVNIIGDFTILILPFLSCLRIWSYNKSIENII